MSNHDQICRNCMGRHICLQAQVNGLNGTCEAWKPRTNKIKPRRLCDFCERRMPILDDYGRYTMESVKTESCPTVNLTTGERTEPDENGEYVLLIFDENGHGIDPGMFPIKFCPLCGRKLDGDGEKP